MIRLARAADCRQMRGVEEQAGAAFVAVGMPDIAADEPAGETELLGYVRAGQAWVATRHEIPEIPEGPDDVVVAYALVEQVDGCAHVEQLSVCPTYARQGIGRAMLDEVAAWARGQELAALTLTTFAEVAWNAPYYARLGFRVLSESELTPGLDAIVAREKRRGLAHWPRVCMRRDVPAGAARAG